MNGDPTPTPYHPRWYRARTSTYWWLERWSYFAFILREISSVSVAWVVLVVLKLVHALAYGNGWYQGFLAWSRQPVVVFVNVLALFLVMFHAITWFNLAPTAMVVRVAGRRVPGPLIAGSNYAAWALVSAVVAWFLLRG
jgi:fumarate reductase subunit C